jgi:hypothetical protein
MTDANYFMVILKPASTCTFKNTIAVLDEMAINRVHSYALVELTGLEAGFVDKMEKNK